MQLKTLFSLLIVSCFLCACANNTNTENASVQTPINTPVVTANESTEKTEESSQIAWLDYIEHDIWNKDVECYPIEDYNKMTLDNPDFFNDIYNAYGYGNSVYYNSERLGVTLYTEGALKFNTKVLTKYGYFIEQVGYDTVYADYETGGVNPFCMKDNFKGSDKLYGGFRKNGERIELVVNHLDKNMNLLNQCIYIANTEDLSITNARVKGQYSLTNLENNEKTNLALNTNYNTKGFKDYSHYYICVVNVNNRDEGAILFSKCHNRNYQECNHLSLKNSELYGLKYEPSTKSFTLHLLNNIEACLYDEFSFYDDFEFHYGIPCKEGLSFGKAVYKMTLK